MGNYKTINQNVDNTKLPRLFPQPQYQIKTKPPVQKGYPWEDNIKVRIREQQLSDESMPLARRKCFDKAMQFSDCRQKQGFFWYVFNCQEDFHELGQCLERQYNVEMDKRRRDMDRNQQKWWRCHYNEDGEVGQQAQSKQQDLSVFESIKATLFSRS